MMSKSLGPYERLQSCLFNFSPFCFFCSLTFGTWSKHDEYIGSVELPASVDAADFLGAEKETR
jgi:hypothetical protein